MPRKKINLPEDSSSQESKILMPSFMKTDRFSFYRSSLVDLASSIELMEKLEDKLIYKNYSNYFEVKYSNHDPIRRDNYSANDEKAIENIKKQIDEAKSILNLANSKNQSKNKEQGKTSVKEQINKLAELYEQHGTRINPPFNKKDFKEAEEGRLVRDIKDNTFLGKVNKISSSEHVTNPNLMSEGYYNEEDENAAKFSVKGRRGSSQ